MENSRPSLAKLGGWAVKLGSEEYPSLLAEIPDPPPVLFGLGDLPRDPSLFLGMVGPRRPSSYGARVARWLAEDLAREGIVLVSGLARGIDAIVHEAALKAGTPTVAVLAHGLDRVYPPEHAHLAERIRAAGALVTEFPVGAPPLRDHFPRRNRIISGLCRGVLLVEAGEKSGARVTARHAVEQFRDVYAVPGPIDAPLSFWPNRLIADGAKIVLTSADVLDEFKPGVIRPQTLRPSDREAIELSSIARKVLEQFVSDTPSSVDDLTRRGDLPVGEVMQALTELEMKGVVARQPDARYARLTV